MIRSGSLYRLLNGSKETYRPTPTSNRVWGSQEKAIDGTSRNQWTFTVPPIISHKVLCPEFTGSAFYLGSNTDLKQCAHGIR